MALSLGECLLRDLRLSRGLTQEQLSFELKKNHDISASHTLISLIERGVKQPGPLLSRGICLVLGCVEADLYEYPRT